MWILILFVVIAFRMLSMFPLPQDDLALEDVRRERERWIGNVAGVFRRHHSYRKAVYKFYFLIVFVFVYCKQKLKLLKEIHFILKSFVFVCLAIVQNTVTKCQKAVSGTQ